VSEAPRGDTERCTNCGAAATGAYCARCGQRVAPHIHSVWGFIREATESLTHADSRLWRTLSTLLVKPGRLTREFLDGRRASYLPPFRLYLVLSLLFFVLASLLGEFDLDDLDRKTRPTPAKPAPSSRIFRVRSRNSGHRRIRTSAPRPRTCSITKRSQPNAART
jgi:hypothetical protein